MCVLVCERTSVDLKDEGLGGGSVAKQCLLSVSQHRKVHSEAVHSFTSADRYLRLPWH